MGICVHQMRQGHLFQNIDTFYCTCTSEQEDLLMFQKCDLFSICECKDYHALLS